MGCHSSRAFIRYEFRFCALKTWKDLTQLIRTKFYKKRPETDREPQVDRQTDRRTYKPKTVSPVGMGNDYHFP